MYKSSYLQNTQISFCGWFRLLKFSCLALKIFLCTSLCMEFYCFQYGGSVIMHGVRCVVGGQSIPAVAVHCSLCKARASKESNSNGMYSSLMIWCDFHIETWQVSLDKMWTYLRSSLCYLPHVQVKATSLFVWAYKNEIYLSHCQWDKYSMFVFISVR